MTTDRRPTWRSTALLTALGLLVGVAAAIAGDDAAPEPAPTPTADPTAIDLSAIEPAPGEPAAIEPAAPEPAPTGPTRTFVGSIQLDYLAVPTDGQARDHVFDGATAEISVKTTIELHPRATASLKFCIACHGLETGMAYFDFRLTDGVALRVGRFTPAFGNFPLRHDPANHRTSDKPLPYDMGRMVRFRDWNEGVLPAPWVDNGVELAGTRFFRKGQLDWAVHAMSGAKGSATASDLDYTLSRSGERYYVDNNSEPAVGGRLAVTIEPRDDTAIAVGASAMAGHYDPDRTLRYAIAAVEAVVSRGATTVRAEYLIRRTDLSLGAAPEQRFKYGPGAAGWSDYFLKDGFYVELERPVGRVDVVARWDGLRRAGNVLTTSQLRSKSAVLRYTLAGALRLERGLRLKVSLERYDFSDFDDDLALHLGLAGSL